MNAELSLVHGPPLSEEPGQGAHTIPAWLAEVRARHGAAEAVVMRTAAGRIAWSYDELYRQAMAVARALVAGGVRPGARIGVLMANRPEYLAAVFGIAMAGGITVALSTFSTLAELEQLLAISGPELLLFDTRVMKQDFGAMLGSIGQGSPARRVQLDSVTDREPAAPGYESWAEFLASGISANGAANEAEVASRSAAVRPDDIAGIFFSSGTTRLPKGIVHAHRAFCIQWWRWPRVFSMRGKVRSWTGNGLFWSGNISLVIGTALATGGAAVLQPVFDASAALDAIERERVSFLAGRPHQWARVQAAPNWSSADLSSLKYVTKGELIAQHPSIDSDWTTPMAFGTTETMTICTAFDAETSAEAYAGSAGGALPGNTLKIVDPLTGTILPRGVSGEFCVKGPTLMTGYLGKSPAETFDAEGFYHTGDGGWIDEAGRFHWQGRLTGMIKTGGANVSPEEVDAVIAAFPGVKRSQTLGLPDDLLGETVVACIVPLDGGTVDPAGLQAWLRDRLASFKLPRRVLFFEESDFPLTGNEKVKLDELKLLAAERLADR